MRSIFVAVGLLSTTSLHAATYVEEPALGHWVMGVGLHGGSTVASDQALVPLGIAGVTATTGYAWESGLSVLSCGGFTARAADDARSAFVGAEAASLREWSLGLALRFSPFSSDVAPFVEVGAHAVVVRSETVSTQGGMVSGKLGVRVRLEGFEPWVAGAVDEVRIGAAEPSRSTRLTLAVGIVWSL